MYEKKHQNMKRLNIKEEDIVSLFYEKLRIIKLKTHINL